MIDPPLGRVVEPAELRADLVHDHPPVLLAGHVEVPEMRQVPCGPDALDHCLARRIRATRDDHHRAGFRQHFRGPRTNALPGPTDQRYLVLEVTHCFSPCLALCAVARPHAAYFPSAASATQAPRSPAPLPPRAVKWGGVEPPTHFPIVRGKATLLCQK
jgi:hypothetical protein